jgi:hypothetical protein
MAPGHLTGDLAMMSGRTAIGLAVGSAVGGITFVIESALVAILPPLGGVTRWSWFPNTVLLLLALGVGTACGLVVSVFRRLAKRCILVGAICAYALINMGITVFLESIVPEDFARPWLSRILSCAITFAHIVAFTIGVVVGYTVKGKAILRLGRSGSRRS